MDKLNVELLFNSFKLNLLSYLYILKKDFSEVNQFINSLKIVKPFKLDVRESTTVQNALNVALVIAYARDFKRNYGFYNTNEINLQLIQDFDNKELELHRTIIKRRDTEFAHADSSSYDAQIYDEGMFSHSLKVVRQLLEKDELDMLSKMVNKIRKQIDSQISCLK